MTTQSVTPTATSVTQTERPRVRPRTDVYETHDALVLVADVPGADQDSVELSLSEGVLELRARNVLGLPEGWQPAPSTHELPDYERTFRLAAEIEPGSIHATLQNGRLRVVLEKRKPSVSRIAVKAG